MQKRSINPEWVNIVATTLFVIVISIFSTGCVGGGDSASTPNNTTNTQPLTWDNGNWDENNWE